MSSIINRSIKQLSHRYGLIPIGTGGSNKEHKSSMESVSFHLKRKLTKEEGRILLVEIVELFLHNINGNKEIASFLYNTPFTYKNLQIRVFIFDKDGSDLYHPDLGLISLTSRETVDFVTYTAGTSSDYASDVEDAYKTATQS